MNDWNGLAITAGEVMLSLKPRVAGRHFMLFCSCDLDLDLHIWTWPVSPKMYLHIKNDLEVNGRGFQKWGHYRQLDRQMQPNQTCYHSRCMGGNNKYQVMRIRPVIVTRTDCNTDGKYSGCFWSYFVVLRHDCGMLRSHSDAVSCMQHSSYQVWQCHELAAAAVICICDHFCAVTWSEVLILSCIIEEQCAVCVRVCQQTSWLGTRQ